MKSMAYRATIIGLAILTFIFLSVFLTSAIFLVGGVASWLWAVVSAIAAVTLIYYLTKKSGDTFKQSLLSIAAFIIIVVSSVGISSYYIDPSFDGNWYHKEAVGLLKDGWNPVYEKSDANTYIYVDAYPKASWTFAANLYSLTGTIEAGKSYNVLLVIAVFMLAYGYLRLRFSRNQTLMLAGALALGTVTIAQLQTYYVDGALGCLIILLTIALNMVVDKVYKGPWWVPYAVIVMAVIVVGNLKFTGLLYAGAAIGVYWLYTLFTKDWKVWRRITISGIVGLILALTFVGAPTYIKNTINHGTPVYPLLGDESTDIMTTNQPITYAEKPGLYKFFESNFGESMNISDEKVGEFVDSPLKIPFTIKLRELNEFAGGSPDVRQAGYGVWFGGALLLSAVAAILLGIRAVRRRVALKNVALVILPVISVGLLIIVLQEAWWARYLPHLTIIPVAIAAALFATYKTKSVLPYIIMFVLFVNVALMSALYMSFHAEYTDTVRSDVYSQVGCKEGEAPRLQMAGMLAIGSRYNILDQCSSATFEKGSDGRMLWNDLKIKVNE